MPTWVLYFIKLNIAITFIFIFYHFALRRLTFYHCNRGFLLGYSFLCLLLPFADIGFLIESPTDSGYTIINSIPSINHLTGSAEKPPVQWAQYFDLWTMGAYLALLGSAFMLIRFCLRYFSFCKIRKNAKLVGDWPAKLYQVEDELVPFSFGNGIFLNQNLHSMEEIPAIIKHEFVHVKQKHTIDVLFAEFLCMLLWYNPFVWLLRLAIRQNLEYIADSFVLEKGTDKKNYQYLLLKVMSNQAISFTNPFNFSSLKNRIIMMNKIKTSRVQLLKFLFALPFLALMLVAFRNQRSLFRTNTIISHADSIPKKATTSTNVVAIQGQPVKVAKIPSGDAQSMTITSSKITVQLKNGKKQIYDLNKPADRASFEKKYGFLPASGEKVISYRVSNDHEFGDAISSVSASGEVSKEINSTINDTEYVVIKDILSPVTVETPVKSSVNVNIDSKPAVTAIDNTQVAVVSAGPTSVTPAESISTTGEIILDLSRNSTKEDLDKKVQELKAKGYAIQVNQTEFKDGKLVSIDAEITNQSDKKQFKAHDFTEMIITADKKADKTPLLRFYVVRGSLTVH